MIKNRVPSRFVAHSDLPKLGIKLSKSQIARMIQANQFPPKIIISDRKTGWMSDTLYDWLEQRPVQTSE